MSMKSKFNLKIKNFVYNGFYGQDRKGYAKYRGLFIEWTNDPGIARIECSDGKERRIPSFAIFPRKSLPPEPDYNKMKAEGTFLYFGTPSVS